MGDQIFERHPRRGPAAAVVAGVDAAAHLLGDLGIVDGHFVAGDDHLDADRQRLVGFAVVVEESFVAIFAVGDRADLGPRRRFALIEHGFHRAEKGLDTVLVGQRLGEVAAEKAARMLRRDVAQQLDRESACCFR